MVIKIYHTVYSIVVISEIAALISYLYYYSSFSTKLSLAAKLITVQESLLWQYALNNSFILWWGIKKTDFNEQSRTKIFIHHVREEKSLFDFSVMFICKYNAEAI